MSHRSSQRSLILRTKLLITALAVSGTAAVAGLATFGTFTSTTSTQSPTFGSGTVSLDFGANGTTNRLAVGATNLAPGDLMQRGFTLRNSGSLADASITMAISDATPSLLDSVSGIANGLTIEIDRCSTGFTESGSLPYTYTCSGTRTVVLAATPVATVEAAGSSGVALPGLSALAAGGSDGLVAQFLLPTGAGNAYQGLTSTLGMTFTATQRTGTSQ